MTTTERTEPRSQSSEDPRYRRLMRATYRAAGEGYDAVSMRRLAAETRMSLAKIYEFARSKDELIALAHADGMAALRDDLAGRSGRARTARTRVRAALNRIADPLEKDETRTRALMRAMYSTDPSIGESLGSVGDSFTGIIDEAIGDVEVPHRAATIEILGAVVNSAILQWLNGRLDASGVRASFHRAVDVLLEGH